MGGASGAGSLARRCHASGNFIKISDAFLLTRESKNKE